MSSSLSESVTVGRGEVNLVSPFDLGWTAGIVDGEGSIGLVRYFVGGKRWLGVPHITVSNTNLPMLDRLKSLWGGTIYGPVRKKGRKVSWYWRLRTSLALRTMYQNIVQLLSVKQSQAFVALLVLDTFTSHHCRSSPLSKNEHMLRHTSWCLIKWLNNRGSKHEHTSGT